MAESTDGSERIRTAEVIASCCLATDLGMGFPLEHGLQATLMTMRLADLLEVDSGTAAQAYYASLLMYSGCTIDAEVSSRIFGSSVTENLTPAQFGSVPQAMRGAIRALPPPDIAPHQQLVEIARRLPVALRFQKPHFASMCEVATMLAERLGLPPEIHRLFELITERWDGKSILRRAKSEDVPLPLRIVHTARDAAVQQMIGGDDYAAEMIRRRAGQAFDPVVANVFADNAPEVLSAGSVTDSGWQPVLAAEPKPWLILEGKQIDRAFSAMGDFADLVSPSLSGHSAGVAELAAAAAQRLELPYDEVAAVGRAGRVHDVGRVAVDPRIWHHTGRLTAAEWEEVRLHAYHTERVLHRSPYLSSLAAIACTHHERLDGSGYHRQSRGAALPPAARILATADAFHAMTESRMHRQALEPEKAAEQLVEEGRKGRHDPEVVTAVLESAGQSAPPVERPAGLSEREAEVVGLLARGLQTKQVARALDISVKTADRHIQNAYRKMDVSTRAGATLFAMEHGLVAWGELPIPR